MKSSPTNLLTGLEALRGADPRSRIREAWTLLVRTADAQEFEVGLDFAVENDLLPMELVAKVRGQIEEGPQYASWVNPIDGSEMIWIAPGPYLMGKDNVRAECEGFFLARHPVTNAQFQRFLDETGYVPPSFDPDPSSFLSHWEKGNVPRGLEEHPVVWVSSLDAIQYCRWAGLALPTEWQWEKAARGPDGQSHPWGELPPFGSYPRKYSLAHVQASTTCAVGSFPRTRTPYGCEDLIGNVSEWCRPEQDWPETDLPMLVGMEAPVRGACFLRTDPRRMAAWRRRQLAATRRNRWVGFRPAFFQRKG